MISRLFRRREGGGPEAAIPAASLDRSLGRTAILVLGMHRSGTSAIAHLVGALGAALPADPIPPHPDNRKGFFESAGIVTADESLLRSLGSSWFDPRPFDPSRLDPAARDAWVARFGAAVAAAFGEAPLFAVKDPRQCRFVPLVVDALAACGAAAKAVLVLRSASAVARSLAARDGTSPAYAQLLWLRHVIDAERATRAMPRAILRYDAVLTDWRSEAARLLPIVGGVLPGGEAAAALDAFFDPRLRHHADTGAPLAEPLRGIVAAVQAGLDALRADDGPAGRAAMDHAAAMLGAAPWIEGDIVHDELRHRRTPPAPAAPDPEQAAALATIRASGLFDEAWYLATYPDVASSGLGPIEHYLAVGAAEGRNPHPLFDTAFYARQLAARTAAGAR